VTSSPTDPDWLDGDAAARWAAEERDDLEGEVAERIRAQWARVRWLDRFREARGRPAALGLLGGHAVQGQVCDAGRDWLSLRSGTTVAVVRAGAVLSVDGLPDAADAVEETATAGLAPGHALRRLVAGRRPARLLLVDGSRVEGTLVRVGADAVDVVRHPADRPPRTDDRSTTVPWAALAAVVVG
jgi:hypothetical protein